MQDDIIKEYSRLAKAYDRRWSSYIEATTQETVKRLCLRSKDRVLDVGCGTGSLLYHVSKNYPDVQLAGVDPVKEMLEVARQKLPTSIDLREGWTTQLPFSDQQFDVVVCCSMFHYIAEPQAALFEIHRVLRPGGTLIITDWCNDYFTMRICDVFLRIFNKAHSKTYGSKDIKILLQENKFTVQNIETYKINWWWGMMTLNAE